MISESLLLGTDFAKCILTSYVVGSLVLKKEQGEHALQRAPHPRAQMAVVAAFTTVGAVLAMKEGRTFLQSLPPPLGGFLYYTATVPSPCALASLCSGFIYR